MTIASPAQSFRTLVDLGAFFGPANPQGALIEAADGNFYGTSSGGGFPDEGTIFSISPTGFLALLYTFCPNGPPCTDGASPMGGVLLGTDGNFYGTTANGGVNCQSDGDGCGTVFKVTQQGTLTTLYSFCSKTNCADGNGPTAMMQGSDGNFYGTTTSGGTSGNCGSGGCGTIFKITPTGKLTTLHSFDKTDGESAEAGLVQGTDGNFYGTTASGGANGDGTVVKITLAGKLTTLHSFDQTDGESPEAGMVQGTDGNFYGTTVSGGPEFGLGSVFKITPAGTLTTLYSFCSKTYPYCTDGNGPQTGLIQGTDGNFYGTTEFGGSVFNCSGQGCGTVFKITPTGSLKTLYAFCANGGDCADGSAPLAGLLQGTEGIFYGTTTGGGFGTVFSLSVGLGPFVETLPASAKVGSTLQILGTNLNGASKVSFNGTAATFSQVAATEIKTSVPTRATTGFVTVTIPSGTLKSNKIFRVIPQISSFSPASGPDGTVVTINGKTFKGASSVTFGGVKATDFKVESYTQITATVPSGAKTGKVSVTTIGGTATSSGTFTVP
jgi:uncharacterized repeat protein (TIGR03803 family)